MLYHYTDRDTTADIKRDKVIRASDVVVYDQLVGGKPIVLAKATWFTTADKCQTVEAKLLIAGWPLHQAGILYRFAIEDSVAPMDLPEWAYSHEYDPQLFRWMLLTAQLAGENWENWRLVDGDVPIEKISFVQSRDANGNYH